MLCTFQHDGEDAVPWEVRNDTDKAVYNINDWLEYIYINVNATSANQAGRLWFKWNVDSIGLLQDT